jgi:crossover junction endodeoxyribonuclease RusA
MIVITLPFPPSTNNLFINTSRGRIRSSKYDEWATEAGWELKRQRPPVVVGPVSLTFEFQSGRDKRKRDITNLLKAPAFSTSGTARLDAWRCRKRWQYGAL